MERKMENHSPTDRCTGKMYLEQQHIFDFIFHSSGGHVKSTCSIGRDHLKGQLLPTSMAVAEEVPLLSACEVNIG